ncbi:DUF3037 domain-containing protein [Pseudobacter ginsenosidimutans]|uniref:DUF3037 family protein n=1 Tax=Pseudobacter ginsenosidimutans TaxID=661488 RepID=A0A4Q7MWK7_9BACT|nr:DUF3037 domain-containing protein [Pseudobacter ginsenosidimutans]QEC40834.1 DUF3037 domain-containing protein [Pseudobacter ginsenosidimutans]RZS72434.1 DUF3037 family protein [Pseudobacter ginsenosidimutans]
MQEAYLFEYAVLRIVPRVEREEFLNTGVILYCKDLRFLQTIITIDTNRLLTFAPKLDIEEVQAHLQAFEQISLGNPAAGPIAKLDMPSRFRWLTATRSTVIQSSKVHPGLSKDPLITLQKLHAQLVL